MNEKKEITADLELLRVRSEKLKEETDAALVCIRSITQCSKELESLWKGEAADAFYVKLQGEIAYYREMIGVLNRTKDSFDAAVKIYSDSEQRALEAVRAIGEM